MKTGLGDFATLRNVGNEQASMDLLKELKGLLSALEEAGIEYALCGGLAMAVYAFPRATLDIDILIEPQSLDQARLAARKCGFSHDSGLMRFQKGAIRIHRLCKIAPGAKDELVLDLLLVTPAIRGVWDSRRKVDWEEGRLTVVSPKGLIALKSLRGSGQDKDDIAFLRSVEDET